MDDSSQIILAGLTLNELSQWASILASTAIISAILRWLYRQHIKARPLVILKAQDLVYSDDEDFKHILYFEIKNIFDTEFFIDRIIILGEKQYFVELMDEDENIGLGEAIIHEFEIKKDFNITPKSKIILRSKMEDVDSYKKVISESKSIEVMTDKGNFRIKSKQFERVAPKGGIIKFSAITNSKVRHLINKAIYFLWKKSPIKIKKYFHKNDR